MRYMDYELSRCPYCGSEINKYNKDWLRYDKSYGFALSCECGACGPKKETKEKAIMAWNRRECFDMESIWKPFDIQENVSGFKGSLKSIEFASVLQILLNENKSGILQVFQGRKRSAICLKNGQVIAASSNYGRQLGQILFDKGMITLNKLQEALDAAKISGKHLGESLLDLGYVDQAALRGLIRQQISHMIQELISCEDGFFQYQEKSIEFDKRGIEEVNIMGVMLDASRLSDEITGDIPAKAKADS